MVETLDALVVGGGPIGAMVARLLGPDHRVMVLEEHDAIGSPVQCTGLLSPNAIRETGVSPTTYAELTAMVVHFPGGRVLRIPSDTIKGSVVDRGEMDTLMMSRALDSGAELRLGHRVTRIHRCEGGYEAYADGERFSTRLLIGADGHRSTVARSTSIGGARESVRGMQADIDHVMEDQSAIHIHMGNSIAPGFFGWALPCGDFTRVGLGTSWSAGPPNGYLIRMLKGFDATVLRTFSGIIPIGTPSRTYGDNVMVVGDAAGQVKPISGGGIWPGLRSAGHLADVASRALAEGDLSSRSLRRYQSAWRSELSGSLDRAMRLRKMYLGMSDAAMDDVGRMIDRGSIVSMLGRGDIDDPAAVAMAIIPRLPGLMRHMGPMMRSMLRGRDEDA